MKQFMEYVSENKKGQFEAAILLASLDEMMCQFSAEHGIDPYSLFEVACDMLRRGISDKDSPVTQVRKEMLEEEKRRQAYV